MAKGIIYVMTTVVSGLIKIGKTGSENFEQRMYNLEHNGYFNVVGLKRRYAIEVDNYNEKEAMLDEIFSKSRVPNSELFALDADLVVQLLSSFDGTQIYPKPEMELKKDVFEEATKEYKNIAGWEKVPDGEYQLSHNIKGFGNVTARMRVEDGSFVVLKGSVCCPIRQDEKRCPDVAKTAIVKDNILQEDVVCSSPSMAGWVVLNRSNNGWVEWKNSAGNPIDVYRQGESNISQRKSRRINSRRK